MNYNTNMQINYSKNNLNLKGQSGEKNKELTHLLIKHDLIYVYYSNLDKIIKCLLCDFCDVDICGYNVDKKEYWGKQIKNNICILMFTLEFSNNYIKIIPLIGGESCIKELYMNIYEGLQIYKTSPFLFE
jgi:hypothetical protein